MLHDQDKLTTEQEQYSRSISVGKVPVYGPEHFLIYFSLGWCCFFEYNHQSIYKQVNGNDHRADDVQIICCRGIRGDGDGS
ncbi:MAG: hypothetical protein GX102_06210 [Porphyromonadaceae bacterium]|nr:hypothetical protein [Porphyromonadaceae bacterium]